MNTMSIRTFVTTLSSAAAVLLAFGAADTAGAQTTAAAARVEMRQVPVPVQDYDLYVDLPTRFAFIKAPEGWKFIGQLDEAQMAKLPPGTLTALLQDVPEDTATAQAQPGAMAVKTGDLFVDPPTGFAFVKTPTQWKFIGKLDASQMAHLPTDTLTSLLLPSADDAPRYAAGRVAQRKF